MDRIKTYSDIATSILEEIYLQHLSSSDQMQYHLVSDDARHQYLLVMDGWINESRFYGILIHIQVRADGILCIHDDNTDLIVVDRLLARGIPKQDMVLGWHAPSMRADTEFAAH